MNVLKKLKISSADSAAFMSWLKFPTFVATHENQIEKTKEFAGDSAVIA